MQGRRSLSKVLFSILAIVLVSSVAGADSIPAGTAPNYTARTLTAFPNEPAVLMRFWAPGLNDGYVPQGLTLLDGALFIAAYKSVDPRQGRVPCRVFKVDRVSGTTLGAFDVPSACGHAGGLASGGKGVLYVVDTLRVFAVDAARAVQDGNTEHALLYTVALGGAVKGSFAAADAEALWLGVYDPDSAKIFRIPFATLRAKGGTLVTEQDATLALPVDAHAQGAAFDRDGKLWISYSNSKFGRLQKLDARDGKVLADFSMPIGIEDIEFDAEGRLWAVSEAGSQRWQQWSAFHPLVLRFAVDRLR